MSRHTFQMPGRKKLTCYNNQQRRRNSALAAIYVDQNVVVDLVTACSLPWRIINRLSE